MAQDALPRRPTGGCPPRRGEGYQRLGTRHGAHDGPLGCRRGSTRRPSSLARTQRTSGGCGGMGSLHTGFRKDMDAETSGVRRR